MFTECALWTLLSKTLSFMGTGLWMIQKSLRIENVSGYLLHNNNLISIPTINSRI
jgi:hypothetical protein